MPLIPTDRELLRASRRKPRKGRPVKVPLSLERDLRTQMGKLWREILLPATERIKELVRTKASPSIIAEEIERALVQAQFQYGHQIDHIVDRWAMGVDRAVANAIHKTLYDSMGVDVTALLRQPQTAEAMRMATTQASLLIKTIPHEYLGQVARAVADNFAGSPLPEKRSLLQQIQHVGGVSYRRSKLIARDQTSKLTSALNSHRQQACGIETYVWRTVRDQRVVGDPTGISPVGSAKHGDHYHMDGKLFRWDDNSVYSDDGGKTWRPRPDNWGKGTPGFEIQCRCWAQPIIDPSKIVAKTGAL